MKNFLLATLLSLVAAFAGMNCTKDPAQDAPAYTITPLIGLDWETQE